MATQKSKTTKSMEWQTVTYNQLRIAGGTSLSDMLVGYSVELDHALVLMQEVEACLRHKGTVDSPESLLKGAHAMIERTMDNLRELAAYQPQEHCAAKGE